jgi:DNA-cytosine methyltransferase
MKGLSLFSGIGGLDIAAEWAGITPVLLSEIEPYACSILRKRWEKIQNVGDITRYTDATLRELGGFPFYPCGKCPADDKESIDIIYGGFPCQDVSVAGKQRGLSGKRSRLWFEMLRVIREIRPRYVLAENVRGAVNLALDTVYANLVDEGYKVYPYVIPASAVGAPHQRERLFVLGVREDVHRRYTEAMANPGCALRQGGEFCGADGVETGNRDADKPERPSSTLWPTLTGTERSGINPKTDSGAGLSKTVKFWPTPRAQEPGRTTEGYGRGLQELVEGKEQRKLCPTPRQFMYKDSTTDRNKGNIGEKVGGRLNPDWVEQLLNTWPPQYAKYAGRKLIEKDTIRYAS